MSSQPSVLQYFLGLDFQSCLTFSQLKNLQKNFSLSEAEPLVLQLTPIFSLDEHCRDLVESFKEILDGHFWGQTGPIMVDFFEMQLCQKDQRSLYLIPKLPDQIHFLVEELEEAVTQNTRFQRSKKFFPKLFLGDFEDTPRVLRVLETLNESFHFPLNLQVKTIDLYQKNLGPWYKHQGLYALKTTEGPSSFLLPKDLAL